MKLLILFAVGVLFGSVQCDVECFRAVFKECVGEPKPVEKMTMCDDFKNTVNCMAGLAKKCDMHFVFTEKLQRLNLGMESVCTGRYKDWFNDNKACFKKQVNDSECTEPMNAAMKDLKTTEEFIRANKKICTLFETYSTCVDDSVFNNCPFPTRIPFHHLFGPYTVFSEALCEELILPADEKDNRPDNFGNLNVYSSVSGLFV